MNTVLHFTNKQLIMTSHVIAELMDTGFSYIDEID